MNKSTILYLVSLAASLILLLSISAWLTNSKINEGTAEREQRNLLQEIIDHTSNNHPVINKDLEGKTVVINVWASWCGPCLREIPELNALVKDFASEEIRFIALDDLDEKQEKENMEQKNIDFDFELYFEQKEMVDLLFSFQLDHEGRGIPLTLVLNTEGKPEFYYTGYQPDKLEELRAYLSKQTAA